MYKVIEKEIFNIVKNKIFFLIAIFNICNVLLSYLILNSSL